MAVQRRFQTADTASSTLAVKPSAFSVAAGPRKTTNTTCSSFEKLSDEFASFHSNSLNVVLHLITTPLLYIAALALLASVFPGSTTGLFLAAYGGILIGTLPYKYGIPSIACLFLFSALVGWMRLCTRYVKHKYADGRRWKISPIITTFSLCLETLPYCF